MKHLVLIFAFIYANAFAVNIPSPDENRSWLGYGFNPIEEQLVSKCITGIVIRQEVETTDFRVSYGKKLKSL